MAALILLSLVSVQCDQSRQSNPSPPAGAPASNANEASPPGPNAVQKEMRLLHEALRDSVTAIANGTVESIPER